MVHHFLMFCFTITFSFHPSEAAKTRSVLQRGSSLTVQHNTSDFLTSPDGSFTCGFYGVGTNAFWFSIWFANSKDRTVVWMANRDRPVNGLGSKASLTRDGSLLVLNRRRWHSNMVYKYRWQKMLGFENVCVGLERSYDNMKLMIGAG